MKPWLQVFGCALVLVSIPGISFGQVMVTAEPSGSGKNSLQVALSYETEDEYGTHIPYVSYVRGVGALDVYVSAGTTLYQAQAQVWVSGGGNLRLLKVGKNSLSVFGTIKTPLHRKQDAARALLNSAVVVSRQLGQVSVYVAFNVVKPLGEPGSGFFTPAKDQFKIPIGAAIRMDNMTMFVEIRKMSYLGMGLRTFF